MLDLKSITPARVSRRIVVACLLLLVGLVLLEMTTLGVKSMKSYININLFGFGSKSFRGGSNIENSYHELINVARGKNTTQSSVLESYGANLAVDGDIRTFSHTNDGSAWIQIDLYESYYVHSINILNGWCRDQNDHSGCLCRLSSAKLFLLDKDGVIVAMRDFENTCGINTVVEDFDDGCLFENVPSDFSACLPAAQRVKIESTTGEQIQLFEVQVISPGIDHSVLCKNINNPVEVFPGNNAIEHVDKTIVTKKVIAENNNTMNKKFGQHAEKRLLSNIDMILCELNSSLPKEWCMDQNGTPRYVGHASASYNTTTYEIKRYSHEGFQQCLANKTIVFIGDSRVRYQLMNLLNLLRKSQLKKQDYQQQSSDEDCYLTQHGLSGKYFHDWKSHYIRSAMMLEFNNTNDGVMQHNLCDCYREAQFSPQTTYENRYVKHESAYGEVNLIYLQNFQDLIRMNKDYPPYSQFWSTGNRCSPGECGEENRTNTFSGNTNQTIWQVLPLYNTTHAFVSKGWGKDVDGDPIETDISCTLKTFQEHHPHIKMYSITHPASKNQVKKNDLETWFDMNKLECSIDVLDRQTMCKNVPKEWYSDNLHVRNILNEEFNHRLIETLCSTDV